MAEEATVTTKSRTTAPADAPSKNGGYPAAQIGALFAPPVDEHPADRFRRLLREAQEQGSYIATCGAYDAFTAALMTRLGFPLLYASGWQLAATKSLFPDIGIYASHDMVKLALELWHGIEGARHARFYDTEGEEVLEAPPMFVDIEAGFGGPTQTFTLTQELIRVKVGAVHLENQDPTNRTCGHIVNVGAQKRAKVLVPREEWIAKLRAVKAAAQVTGVDVGIIARTDSVDGAIPNGREGSVQHAVEDALEAADLGVDVIWPEFNTTEIDQPQEFAEGVRKHYPDQMLGFNLSPSLYFGRDKKAGKLITNQQLADLGYILQFSTLFCFRTVGLALEKGLQEFRTKGLEALADLQNAEDAQPGGPPSTKMHQKFAGMNRWLILEQVLSGT